MKKFLIAILSTLLSSTTLYAADTNPQVLTDFLNRIGGKGAAARFVTIVDENLSANGEDIFIITAKRGKPCIKGNNILAVTTGINWYLNHYAHVNISWNNLTTNLKKAHLPLPKQEEVRTCSADYRYYLNYCTFSYSMSVWTWERWQQEIDWMALHGINMPLQIVGLDVVWKRLLTQYYDYSAEEANAFIAGPCFQAWWGMNNLEGWGGPNPEWWYDRQAVLAHNIGKRMRELGMQPVLPGFSGMVPSNFTAKTGHQANSQGNWCYFTRPYILDPNSNTFTTMAANYYKVLKEVMGTSEYYSMDPFHEGANTSGIDVPAAYTAIANAMYAANEDIDEKWVIQFWQWSSAQYHVLDKVEKGKLIILDLFSDAHTHFNAYKEHDAVYCMLPNFGGRTGFMGRFDKNMSSYFENKEKYPHIKGIGATPEAIESMPILYDMLFELPWHQTQPDGKEWMKHYTTNRYGSANLLAEQAWEKLRLSALNCQTTLQGPHEAVTCARPALTIDRVSSWGGTSIYYDTQDLISAAHLLAEATLTGNNYSYDLTDITRQAITDYAYKLLQSVKEAYDKHEERIFAIRRDNFLQLILDLDRLLSTNSNFMLGRWTQLARGIADEVPSTTEADRNWLEHDNARTLITTWGAKSQANYGGLRDYSYRQWAGMLKDYYYPRWKIFFSDVTAQHDWFEMEKTWAFNSKLIYQDTPIGDTKTIAKELLDKFFIKLTISNQHTYYIYKGVEEDKQHNIMMNAFRDTTYHCPIALHNDTTVTLSIDFNNDGIFTDNESTKGLDIHIPSNAMAGNTKAQLNFTDGTTFVYTLTLQDIISEPRSIHITTADTTLGYIAIEGSDTPSITTTQHVTITAKPANGYDFQCWKNTQGEIVSLSDTYIYFGKQSETFTAYFTPNKWGKLEEDLADYNDISSYNQYLTQINISQYNRNTTIYNTSNCPTRLFNIAPHSITAARGSKLSIICHDAGGMKYTYLSAYIDINGDGEFNYEDELIAVKGKIGSTDEHICSTPITIMLPYDMPIGNTRIRLRFDGAWKSGSISTSKGNAYGAKNIANRMVYDILINVTEAAPYPCRITALTNDTNKGTVDANGQDNTYIYNPHDEVVLRAYPSTGFKLSHWKDNHGRTLPKQWMDENNIRFKPYDNTAIEAIFTPLNNK